MAQKVTGPPGTQDVSPYESYKWLRLEDKLRSIVGQYGFKEIRVPTFEHTELFLRGVGDTTDIVNKEMYYILIDEVQYAITKKELENPEDVKLYNVLNGLMHLRNVDIYVTGSNSKLLSQDVMTAFRGRGDQVRVFPLSFKEYYDFVGGDKSEVYELYALYGECRSFYHSNVMRKRLSI